MNDTTSIMFSRQQKGILQTLSTNELSEMAADMREQLDRDYNPVTGAPFSHSWRELQLRCIENIAAEIESRGHSIVGL